MSDKLDPSAARPHRFSRARAIVRIMVGAVGSVIGMYGGALYALRCFDTCPSDPAENIIFVLLTLSLVVFGLGVIVGAVTLRTRFAVAGSWVMTGLGALMVVGAVVSLVLVPSLRAAGDPEGTVLGAVVGLALGVGLIILGRWVRKRETEPSRATASGG